MDDIKIKIFLIVLIVLVAYIVFRKNFKMLNVPSVALVTGGVKTGKSLSCVYLSIKDYKKRLRNYNVRKFLHLSVGEKPLYYTNVFITFGNSNHRHYVKDYEKFKHKGACYYDAEKKQYYYFHKADENIRIITLDSLVRIERYAYKSVIYIQEASLLADNMDFKNVERNVDLSLYAKLIAHETRGGALYLDTQSMLDCHYAFKRVCSTFIFCEKNVNLGLFHVVYLREMVNGEIGVNNFTDDVETTTRKILIPFWYHHRYDRYQYSYLTDELDISNQCVKNNRKLISFNPLYMSRAKKTKKGNEKHEEK